MEKYTLLPADTYVVINKTILHDEDRKILTDLYLPIIGADAVMLYFCLWSSLDNSQIVSKDFSHQKLVSSLRMTINEIYDNMIIDSNSYKGNKNFEDNDEFKTPMIDFNVKREYDELSNKIFTSKDGKEYVIDTAIQTISFSLDEKCGKIKSEAATDVKTTAMPNMNEPRYFNVDNTFALFLKEESKDKPYFAARIENIKKYQ